MANIADPFKQDRLAQAQSIRDLLSRMTQSVASRGQGALRGKQAEVSVALTREANKNKIAASNKSQVDALKRIEAQGAETRKTQEAGFTLAEDRKAKKSASSQATFNELIGRTTPQKDLDTPRGFDPATGGVRLPSDVKKSGSKKKVPTPQEQEAEGFRELGKRAEAGQLTPGDFPSLVHIEATLEARLQNALASPDEKSGRKAALFISNALDRVKDDINLLSAQAAFKARSSKLAEDLQIPVAAITPENLPKFETELVDQLFKGPEIPGSTDVTLQFLIKFPVWREKFQEMQANGETEIDLESPEVTAFLDRNKRMFNTFADKFITKTDTQVDPITSKQAILYRTERDKFLRNLGPFTELQGNIRRLKAQAVENDVWDATVEISDGLSVHLKKLGLTAKIFDEDEVGELEAALAQMRIESVNPLLRSVENVVLNSPIEVQGLFASELSERLQEAGIQSDALDAIIKKLSSGQ